MVARGRSEPAPTRNRTTSERRSERELVTTRTFDAPAGLVFEAWTTPDLFKQWWLPKSSGATLLSCQQDVRVGGSYRLQIAHPKAATPMAFFGKYLEVVPNARLVWTNEESDGAGSRRGLLFLLPARPAHGPARIGATLVGDDGCITGTKTRTNCDVSGRILYMACALIDAILHHY